MATPTESDVERAMRLDFEAAEKSYRTFFAESRRVLRAGGASKATKVMRQTAGGPYLRDYARVMRAYKKVDGRDEGKELIVYVRRGNYKVSEITLTVCEDSRRVRTLDKNGKVIGPGELLRSDLQIRKQAGAWRVWDSDGKPVKSCG